MPTTVYLLFILTEGMLALNLILEHDSCMTPDVDQVLQEPLVLHLSAAQQRVMVTVCIC